MSDPLTVVFILSAPHSGSTWLNLVLGSCSWALNLGEYYRPWTMPGHVACRLCEADGRTSCTLLHGIEAIPRDDAFHFAARRSGKRILIDASKTLDWCAAFLGRPDIDARLIHLVRHPCGFVDSRHRRTPEKTLDEVFAEWERQNREIESFVATAPASSRLACYDTLADDPDPHLSSLCHWLGHDWQPAALNYWTIPHHGLGANGASSVYLKNRTVKNYVTRDDEYYSQIPTHPTAADRRWRDRLPKEFRERAVVHPYAQELSRRLGGAAWLK